MKIKAAFSCGCLQLHAKFSLSLHSDFVRRLQCEVYDMSSTKKRKANTLDQFFQLKQPRVEPPSTQANTADKIEETNAVNKTTSRHRNGFDRSWQINRAWLQFDESSGLMTCSLCKKHNVLGSNGKNAWITGYATLRLDKVTAHSKSTVHIEAVKMDTNLMSSKNLQKIITNHESAEFKAIVSALKCMYWLIKSRIAHTTNFASLLELAEELGAEELKTLKVGGNANYTSEQTIQELIECLADVVENETLQKLKNSPTFSIMIDETTDVAVQKQLVIFARCLVEGKLECRFLKMIELFDGKADTIVTAIKGHLNEKQFQTANISSFGSDGANVMTGSRTGVATQFRRENPKLISVHCIAHRLALATKDAFKDVPYLSTYEDILSTLFYFYHNSGVRSSGLKEIQQILESPVLKMKEAKHVR